MRNIEDIHTEGEMKLSVEEIEKLEKLLADALPDARKVFKEGMSKEEFREQMLLNIGEEKLNWPRWIRNFIHWLIDELFDHLFPVRPEII